MTTREPIYYKRLLEAMDHDEVEDNPFYLLLSRISSRFPPPRWLKHITVDPPHYGDHRCIVSVQLGGSMEVASVPLRLGIMSLNFDIRNTAISRAELVVTAACHEDECQGNTIDLIRDDERFRRFISDQAVEQLGIDGMDKISNVLYGEDSGTLRLVFILRPSRAAIRAQLGPWMAVLKECAGNEANLITLKDHVSHL